MRFDELLCFLMVLLLSVCLLIDIPNADLPDPKDVLMEVIRNAA